MKKLLFISTFSFLLFSCSKKEDTKIIGDDYAGTWTAYDTIPATGAVSQKSFSISNSGSTQLTVTNFPLDTYTFQIGKNTTTDVVTSLNVIPYSTTDFTVTKVNGTTLTYTYLRYECAGTLCPTTHRGRAVKN